MSETQNNTSNKTTSRTKEEIIEWITNYLVENLKFPQEKIDIEAQFDHYELDSMAAVGMTGDLSDWLNQPLSAELLLDYTSIESLADHLGK